MAAPRLAFRDFLILSAIAVFIFSYVSSFEKSRAMTGFVLLNNWWDTSWAYRQNITVTEKSGSALSDFQVMLQVDTQTLISAGKMQSDCDDIRFADSSNSQLSHWIESDNCNKTNTYIWVKIPSLSASANTNITMYYGNPSAASASNGDNTFIFFDNFNGTTLNTTKWSNITDGGSTSVSNSLVLDSNTGNTSLVAAVKSAQTIDFSNSVIEFFESTQKESRNRIYLLNTSGATGTNFDKQGTNFDMGLFYNGATLTSGNMQYFWNGWVSPANSNLAIGTNNTYRYTYTASSLSVAILGTTYTTISSQSASTYTGTPSNITIAMTPDVSVNDQSKTTFYWVRVRKYASTEPSITFVNEEEVKDYEYWYAKQITINNTANSNTLTNFEVNVTLDTQTLISAGKMNSTCNDIRFTNSTSPISLEWSVKYPFYLESGCNTTSTLFWVKIDSIPASSTKTIYAWFGNSSSLSLSSGASTFSLWDDFNSYTLDTSKWSTSTWGSSPPSLTFSNSWFTIAAITSANQGRVIKSASTYSRGSYVLEFYGTFSQTFDNIYSRNGWGSAGTSSVEDTDMVGFGVHDRIVAGNRGYQIITINSSFSGTCPDNTNACNEVWSDRGDSGLSTTNIFGIIWNSTMSALYANYSFQNNFTTYNPTGPEYIQFRLFSHGSSAPGSNGASELFDWVRLRQYTNQEPPAIIGSDMFNFVFSNISSTNITTSSAQVNWTTNYTTNASVNYGTSLSLGSNQNNTSLITGHILSLSALSPSTAYYYNITSCYNDTGPCKTTGPYNFTTISDPPQLNNTNQNTSTPTVGAGVLLSAFWSDDVALSAAVLETNETGSAQNKTTYSSPMSLSGTSAWSNFSWQNSSISAGTAVAWRIFANDSNGNWNVTNSSAFTITATPSTTTTTTTTVAGGGTKTCSCSPAGTWSECKQGNQTRTNYRCGSETSYICQSYTEKKSCASSCSQITSEGGVQLNIPYAAPNSALVCKINSSDSPASEIEISPATDLKDSMLTVKTIDAEDFEKSLGDITVIQKIPELAGIIYKYFDISKENLTSQDISSVKIKFSVENSWIKNNSLLAESVKLKLLKNNQWTEVLTKKTKEDKSKTYYEAEAKDLGLFAVVGLNPIKWSNCKDGIQERLVYNCGEGGCSYEKEVQSCAACPSSCREPTKYSACGQNKQKRTNYICNSDTGFVCKPTEETKACMCSGDVERTYAEARLSLNSVKENCVGLGTAQLLFDTAARTETCILKQDLSQKVSDILKACEKKPIDLSWLWLLILLLAVVATAYWLKSKLQKQLLKPVVEEKPIVVEKPAVEEKPIAPEKPWEEWLEEKAEREIMELDKEKAKLLIELDKLMKEYQKGVLEAAWYETRKAEIEERLKEIYRKLGEATPPQKRIEELKEKKWELNHEKYKLRKLFERELIGPLEYRALVENIDRKIEIIDKRIEKIEEEIW